ncbi:hypothetical protein HanRHA438_Chr04g0166891 [Helianthus annuus]|nr:hypothetical protein HanIR_Chr04g0168781 [Helianthus annuus]KAJ0926078.1 hypothetical protein HanRHA438_Chr04g0166891 [Helianthus annuus]
MVGEQEESDEFSFPTTTSSPPRFIGSPRLWRSSSYSLYNLQQTQLTKQEHEEECDRTTYDRKTINLLSYIRKKGGDDESENMDVIWEDLNYEEEIGCVRRRSDSFVSCDFGREMAEWRRKETDYGGVAVACGGGKRLSMVVVVKVLKKMLLLPRVYRAVKK